jgi:hypothetical protein
MQKESFLKTKLHCSHLAELGGDITRLDLSQFLFLDTLKKVNLLLIKQNIKDLDSDLYAIIKKNIKEHCPQASIDDTQTLFNYIIGNVYSFLNFFPLTTYHPLMIDVSPSATLSEFTIQFNFDFIYKQNNKSNYIHGIVFVNSLNDYTSKYDYFNYLKLKFLKSAYLGKRNAYSATNLHIISIKPLTYRNKNLKNYVLKKHTLTEADMDDFYLKELLNLLSSSFQQKPIPIPACSNFHCSKRKECASTYERYINESR